MNVNNNTRMGLRDGLPIGLGYLAISFAFGIMATAHGIPVHEAVLISAFNLTSAGQLAALPIIASCGSLVELALTQLVINMRYSLMSISLSQKFDKEIRTRDRFYLSLNITDEMFAVAIGKEQMLGKGYLLSLLLFPYLGWTLGTLLGAVSGNVLPEVLVSALGISMYAMFIAILVPAAKKEMPVALCIALSILISCSFEYIPPLSAVSDGFVIIITALFSSVIFALLFPIKDEAEDGERTKEEVSAQ